MATERGMGTGGLAKGLVSNTYDGSVGPVELTRKYVRIYRLDKLLGSAKTYENALNSGTGFLLIAKRTWFGITFDSSKRITIRRLAGAAIFPIVAVLGEFFFAEPMSAATLDNFDVEVSPEEYDLFYAAVEMERDRLLPYLENSDDLEDRDLFLQIRSEIETE